MDISSGCFGLCVWWYYKKNIKKIIYKSVFLEMLCVGRVTPAAPEYADKFSQFPPYPAHKYISLIIVILLY